MPTPSSDHVRAGRRLSLVSIVWTTVNSSGALAVSATSGSLAVGVFGAVGLLDAAASASLAFHFTHALRGRRAAHHDHAALGIVRLGLVGVGCTAVAAGAGQLLAGHHAHTSPVAVALAASALVVLSVLAVAKHGIARRIPSVALHADGWLSAIGAALALVTVAGVVADAAFDWSWADPAAAMAIGAGAAALGLRSGRGRGRRDASS